MDNDGGPVRTIAISRGHPRFLPRACIVHCRQRAVLKATASRLGTFHPLCTATRTATASHDLATFPAFHPLRTAARTASHDLVTFPAFHPLCIAARTESHDLVTFLGWLFRDSTDSTPHEAAASILTTRSISLSHLP